MESTPGDHVQGRAAGETIGGEHHAAEPNAGGVVSADVAPAHRGAGAIARSRHGSGCPRRRSSATSGVCATGCERTSTRPRSSRWNCKIASRRRSPCISAVPPAERKGMPMARDRVVELRRVRAGDLRPDPRNWRRHPPGQLTAWFDVWERPPVCIHWSRTSSPEFDHDPRVRLRGPQGINETRRCAGP